MTRVHPSQFILSHREYEALRQAINDSITDDPRFVHLSPVQKPKQQPIKEPQYVSSFRAATRVYLGTHYGLKAVQALLAEVSARRSPKTATPRKPLIASSRRFALSLSTMLFLHRVLYSLLQGIRKDLLRDNIRKIRERWPRTYDLLTWRLAPAAGASLSGLALGICPADQLRVTIVIYVLVRAGELLYQGAEAAGYLRRKPKWMGSWILAALSQGQMLHAFLFDPDCFPTAYGTFILNNTPEYMQKRPAELSSAVKWPTRREQADSIAEMARLKWPAYISPILRPKDLTTLPPSINPAISPITSRAHPALQHLSCALIHPSETSCFTPFLRQILLSFSSIGRFLAMYYSALSLLRITKLVKSPITFTARLAIQILKSTAAMVLAISGSWGSICFGNNYLPKSFMPKFRFFVFGSIAGSAAMIDRSATGHTNNMYVLRNSLDSLWKVGVKHRWWRAVTGGDVYLFVLSLAAFNMLYDAQRDTFSQDQTMIAVKVLRGDIEVGLKNKTEQKIA